MTNTTTRLTKAVETYLADLKRIQASGGGTEERSSYGPLTNLLNAIGEVIKPKVFCISELADQGVGHPDLGLYTASQVRRRKPKKGQVPERGVVEVKPADDDAWLTAEGDQVNRYLSHYGLVLVTNTRDFVLVGEDATGQPTNLETFQLAASMAEFEQRLEKSRVFAGEIGASLGEYLCRVLSHRARLAEPKDLAWLLASYARDGLTRVEVVGDIPSLKAVRSALEETLGVHFKGQLGGAFFRSTLVQTLFYGVFSAWVLWARHTTRGQADRFDWRTAAWHLRVPVLRALFQQISDPGRLEPLGLVEVLDWTSAALDRVDRDIFFDRFNEGEAVTYFYEPFLAAFDPDLRKQLGVWYTPTEVVRYMVARVDKALRDDLGIADGLAAENVYVLDPCCGTGAYLSEVLRRIADNIENRGLGALTGARVKLAATKRVFGFEIMPAPFVVAHLQVGLTMRALDAAMADDGKERAQVFLTNALTGWEPMGEGEQMVAFPELAEERDRAGEVKQDTPILVILGNPPYNGFAGMAVEEERELSEAYRTIKRVRRPEGQGLNDPYVRFFRMAERRIAEMGQGVVCFISNYSWLDGLSFTGMREHYLETFDVIRIDCLNGDKYKTGKIAPDGSPDPSIFSTPDDPVGIQVGTAIATLVRKADHTQTETIGFRNLWGQAKREKLLKTAEVELEKVYDLLEMVGTEPEEGCDIQEEEINGTPSRKIVEAEPEGDCDRTEPMLLLGLPFVPTAVSKDWFDWPALPDLFPVSFPGVKTSRDRFLVDTDLDRLKMRIGDYFDDSLSHDEIARSYPGVMKATARFNARTVRDDLLERGGPIDTGFVRFAYRPFDNRWLYWESETKLLDEKRADYKSHVFAENMWLVTQQKPRREWSPPQAISHIGCLDLMDRGATCFPTYLRYDNKETNSNFIQHRPNLTIEAGNYLRHLGASVEDLFHHVLATLHDPAYREANAGALRMEWPRIPLPGWPDGKADGAAETLAASAERGRELARLLDPDTPVPDITQGALRPETAAIAVPTTTDGHNMTGDDFALTAGWGHYGAGDAVMPGQGCIFKRKYTEDERAALGDSIPTLGKKTQDVYLNDHAYWRNVPVAIWDYKLGGYQVLKKWLSYRERDVLGRALTPEEVQHFTDMARRVGAMLQVTGKAFVI